jgi:hypothetical protein
MKIASFGPSDALDYIVRLCALHIYRHTIASLGITPFEAQAFQDIHDAWFSLPSFEPSVLAEYNARWG